VSKVGRPTLYTDELADDICRRIATGFSLVQALRDIAKEKGSAPAYDTVIEWLGDGKHEVFTRNYTRARELQGDWDADYVREIANRLERCSNRDEAAGPVEAAKLFIWLAGKRKPKVYGDKIQNELSGEVRVIEQKMVLEEPPPGWKAGPDGG
jgi:hypothetical protein